MKDVSIRQLKEKLPNKFKYAERVVERARENGLTIDTRDVYNTISGRSNVHKAAITRILEILIEESQMQLSAIS